MASFMSIYPFLVLIIGIVFIVVSIVLFRMHAFLALILAAVLVGLLSSKNLEEPDPTKPLRNHAVKALELTAREFGKTTWQIGIVIALASIIGKCLMDSGAADVITRRFIKILGEKRSALSLLGSGYVLAMPVFFDTVFYLLVPLAKAFWMRTRRDFVLYVMAICAGGAITHSLVAPTPGPLKMAENLHLDLGVTILVGTVLGIAPALIGGWWYSRWVSSRLDIPVRETGGLSLAELERIVNRPDEELPSFWLAMLPVALPVVLIGSGTLVEAIGKFHGGGPAVAGAGGEGASWVIPTFQFIGNKNFALFAATAVALWIFMLQKNVGFTGLRAAIEPAIESAGVIILITAAGGAFGAMLTHAGVGDAIKAAVPEGTSGPLLIALGFVVASVIKIAQGSGTVAMISASQIMYDVIKEQALPFHPVYIFAAIGFGSAMISWMNDSGFWVVCQMSGFSERETLKTWTLLLALLALMGLAEVLLLSWLLPLKFLP